MNSFVPFVNCLYAGASGATEHLLGPGTSGAAELKVQVHL